jgi:hypothetical protein
VLRSWPAGGGPVRRLDLDDQERWPQIPDDHYLPFTSITELTVTPRPNDEEIRELLGAIQVGTAPEVRDEQWVDAWSDLVGELADSLPVGPAVIINETTFVYLSDSVDAAWLKIDTTQSSLQDAVVGAAVLWVSCYDDTGGDPPAGLSVRVGAGGGYVMLADDTGWETGISILSPGTSPWTVVAAAASTGVGNAIGLDGVIESLVESGVASFQKQPSDGDEWLDQMTVSISLAESFMGLLQESPRPA